MTQQLPKGNCDEYRSQFFKLKILQVVLKRSLISLFDSILKIIQLCNYLPIYFHSHIYIPFMGGDTNWLKEVQGTVVAFTFIYVWHGAYPAVLWWCVSNFFITVFEKAVDRFCQTSYYNDWEVRKIFSLC